MRAVAWPTLACLTFLVVDGVQALADRFDCGSLQRGARTWQGWLEVFEPLRGAAAATAVAACEQGRGVRLVLAALWAFALAMFLLSLATVVLRSWPKELKQWVDRFAAMIVDAFASGLGESGRARAQGAATVFTWLLALAAPAYALGQLPSIDRGSEAPPNGGPTSQDPTPVAPSEHERAVTESLARIERLLPQPIAVPPPSINVHVANSPPGTRSDDGAGRAVRAARASFEEALRVHHAPLANAARESVARADALDARLRAVEADDQRLAAIRDGLADLAEADRRRLAHESKPLLARWRDNLLGREPGCVADRERAAVLSDPVPAARATAAGIVGTTRGSSPPTPEIPGPHEPPP